MFTIFKKKRAHYAALENRENDEEKEFLQGTADHERARMNHPSRRHSRGKGWYFTAINVVMVVFWGIMAAYTSRHEHSVFQNRRNSLLKRIDAYSPIYDQVEIPLVDMTINGSLLDMDDSIYRKPPSPEVDAAWERISHQLPHVISTEDVVRLGKDPTRTARWPEDWGFGPDAHIAELDIVHTVHCLNAIRRDVHWRHYFKDRYPDGVFPELHRVHTDHCIYIVLQNLMCSANGDIITNVWAEGQLHPFPDFSINKKCRNYDTFIDWHHRTQIDDMEKYLEMRIPEGETPWRMSSEFHRMFGTDEEWHHHDHRGR